MVGELFEAEGGRKGGSGFAVPDAVVATPARGLVIGPDDTGFRGLDEVLGGRGFGQVDGRSGWRVHRSFSSR